MSRNNLYDDDDFRAFVLNESKIKTDDQEEDEHGIDFTMSSYEEPEIDFFR